MRVKDAVLLGLDDLLCLPIRLRIVMLARDPVALVDLSKLAGDETGAIAIRRCGCRRRTTSGSAEARARRIPAWLRRRHWDVNGLLNTSKRCTRSCVTLAFLPSRPVCPEEGFGCE